MIGKTVGKYRIVDKLGRGGMGVVYKAIDETLEREVAIKVLSPDLDESDVMKRFRAEATTLAKLNHPEIATIYELYRSESDLLMVMEYVRGETLEKLSQRSGPLPPERAAYLVAKVLGALHYAHRAGVVHRDMKPANVMVSDDGHVKVMDFGIARVLGADHMTIDGHMMGTPAYMAPEQVLGQEVDARADIYSAGVVFYRLLTGTLPFQADTAIGMVQKQVADAPTPARAHRADLPEWCETVLARALAKHPSERFQTAEEFRQALLGPVNAAETEQTMALGRGATPRPSPAIPAAVVTPLPSRPTAPVPVAAPAAPVAVPPARSTMAAITPKQFAIGGAVIAVLAIVFALMMRAPSTPVARGPSLPVSQAELSTQAPFSFTAKALVNDGDKDRERDAVVTLAQGTVTVTLRDDKTGTSTVLHTLPFSSVQSLSYSKSKEPLWNGPSGPAKVLRLDVPLGFFKGERHWVSLRAKEAFIVLRIDSDDVGRVVSALEARTGRTAERLTERKDDR